MNVFISGTESHNNFKRIREKLESRVKVKVYPNRTLSTSEKALYESQKNTCAYRVFVITNPFKTQHLFDVAELIEQSSKHPHKTLALIKYNGLDKSSRLAFEKILDTVKKSGAKVFSSHTQLSKFLNRGSKHVTK
jgi:hypothetical protein